MSALANWRQQAAEQLREKGIPAVSAFEPEGRKLRTGPVAAVSLARVTCQTGGFQNYLGRNESGEVYGRAVELTLALDIYGPRDSGENACRQLLDRMAELLLTGGLAGLAVQELESERAEFLDGCGMYRLPVRCLCRAWLTAAVLEDGEFVDIRVKGRTV